MSEMVLQLHDATLLEIHFDWALGVCVAKFLGGPSFPGCLSLTWTNVEEIVVPRKYEWGESVSVLDAILHGSDRYEIQMQSGDLIAIVASKFSFEVTDPSPKLHPIL